MEKRASDTHVAENPVNDPVWLILLAIQGAYFAILGAWPIFDVHSFQAITGPKTDHLVTGNENDHWLVLTAGALITVIGLTLLLGAWRKRFPLETAFLGGMSALALAVVDVVYVLRNVIDKIYLADALVEGAFIVGWILVAARQRSTRVGGKITALAGELGEMSS